MKKYYSLFILCLTISGVALMHACTKDYAVPYSVPTVPPPVQPPLPVPPLTTSYTEDFEDFSTLTTKGWLIGEYSQVDTIGTTAWSAGAFGAAGKGDSTWYGFSAYGDYSYPGAYAYSYDPAVDSNLSVSSWMLTPILTVKDSDRVSFYTRGDTTGTYTNRMQVLLNKTASSYIGHDLNSVGDFTTVLMDINPTQAPGGYPTTWKKYEYIFTGITDKMDIRIAFRHYVIHPTNARGIGIDQFKFEVK
jgi:hypothetical protein